MAARIHTRRRFEVIMRTPPALTPTPERLQYSIGAKCPIAVSFYEALPL
jgi:hypothetical protein